MLGREIRHMTSVNETIRRESGRERCRSGIFFYIKLHIGKRVMGTDSGALCIRRERTAITSSLLGVA